MKTVSTMTCSYGDKELLSRADPASEQQCISTTMSMGAFSDVLADRFSGLLPGNNPMPEGADGIV